MASSSAIDGYGYSAINQILDVEFDAGGVYRYSNVTQSTFDGLKNASSQGGYFNEFIRNDHAFTQLE